MCQDFDYIEIGSWWIYINITNDIYAYIWYVYAWYKTLDYNIIGKI